MNEGNNSAFWNAGITFTASKLLAGSSQFRGVDVIKNAGNNRGYCVYDDAGLLDMCCPKRCKLHILHPTPSAQTRLKVPLQNEAAYSNINMKTTLEYNGAT